MIEKGSSSQGAILGFDFGLKQIGIAVAQRITKTASPLEILNAKQGQPDWSQVEKIIKEWQPDTLVVGLPLNMDGSESDMSLRAKKFAQRLQGRFGLNVALQDERLSSFEVKHALQEEQFSKSAKHAGMRNKKIQRDKVDALAAANILQRWLDDD